MFSDEIKHNRILQWALGALVFGYFIVFDDWVRSTIFTRAAYDTISYVCPPYFQSCGSLYILDALPLGYSQTLLYMVFFGILAWCVYLMSKKEWDTVQVVLVPLFFWHAGHTLFFTDIIAGNYEYYLIAFAFILLFLPQKEFFLKLVIVMFYVLSSVSKIHPSWIEGGYFTALRTGLPLFPDSVIPLFTNAVILLEMVGAWFLMSQNRLLQRTILGFFIFFHLYSGIIVEYRYPATVLPFLIIMFGPWYRFTKVPLDKKALIGWVFIMVLIILQFTPKIIPGDEKITAEGNKYGLYMFEANHQCFSEAQIYRTDGIITEENFSSASSRKRCEVYHSWFRLNQICNRFDNVKKIEWKFYHSINGGPFYQMVNIDDVCGLEYKAFEHNDWILLPGEAKEVGYPVKNYYN